MGNRKIYQKDEDGDTVEVSGGQSDEQSNVDCEPGLGRFAVGFALLLVVIASAYWLCTSDYASGVTWKMDVNENIEAALDAGNTALFEHHVTEAWVHTELNGYGIPVLGDYQVPPLKFLAEWAEEVDNGDLTQQNNELPLMKTFLRGYELPYDFLTLVGCMMASLLIIGGGFAGALLMWWGLEA